MVQLALQYVWPQPHQRVSRTAHSTAGAHERPLHARHTASPDGYRGSEGRRCAARAYVSFRGSVCYPPAFAIEFGFRADAWVSQNPSRQIWPRQCACAIAWYFDAPAGVSRIFPAGQSGTPHSGFWQMGNLQAARVDDRVLPRGGGYSTLRPTGDRGRRPSSGLGLCRIDEEKVRGDSGNRVHGLRPRRSIARSFPEFLGGRHAVFVIDRMQRRCPPGVRLWVAHRVRRSSRLSPDGRRGRISH